MNNIENTRIREIEKGIDACYKNNTLLLQPLSIASFYLLLRHEQEFNKSYKTTFDQFINIDNSKYALKYTLKWITDCCKDGEYKKVTDINADLWTQADNLFKLGIKYRDIVGPFIVWSRKLADAKLENNNTVRFERKGKELNYDVLDMKINLDGEIDNNLVSDITDSFNKIKQQCQGKVIQTDPYSFKYSINNINTTDIQQLGKKLFRLATRTKILPTEWEIFGLSVEKMRNLWMATMSLCFIHCGFARHVFLDSEIMNTVMVKPKTLWIKTLRKASGLTEESISIFFDILCYDKTDIKRDIALQPFFPIGNDLYALAPYLVMGNNLERNWLSLLARKYKKEYDKTTNIFENQMADELKQICINRKLDVITKKKIQGQGNLPDIDVALFDEQLNVLLLCELKWTIPTAEAYEVIERSESCEKKGIEQVHKLLNFARNNRQEIWKTCFPQKPFPSNLLIKGCVAIKGFVGTDRNFTLEAPVIEFSVFKNMLSKATNLDMIINSLTSRSFLPSENIDFKKHAMTMSFGDINIIWEGFRIIPSKN